MNTWNEYPFVRILFAFLVGVLLNLVFNVHLALWLLAVSVLLTITIHLLAKNKKLRLYRYAAFIGVSFQCSFLLAGNVITYYSIDYNNPLHFIHSTETAKSYIVKITEPLIEKEKSYKAVAVVVQGNSTFGSQKAFGKTIIYFAKDSISAQIKYGDVLQVKNNFKEVNQPLNPDEFNYKKYLWNREIYATAYLKDNEWAKLRKRIINPVYQFTYHLRDLSLSAIRTYISTPREASVAESLVIGYRDNMNGETTASYTAAGVVHVLAVSGSHVGIIFAMLHQLLFFLNRKKHGKLIQSIIIITLIWLFALLTGLSGSVVRAATMFSFITLGQNLKRSININNILACSAFFLLVINPLLVADVGFQLSYLAVFGITSLSKHINGWLLSENRLIDYLWKIVAMSLAAQLATLPLTLYYFNQFPSYFLIANLIVIPVAALILHLGILLIVLQLIAPFAALIGQLTFQVTRMLNEFIANIQALPHSVIPLPSISLMAAASMGFLIIFLTQFFLSASKRWLFCAVMSAIAFFSVQSYKGWMQHKETSLILYSLKGNSILEFRDGKQALLFQEGSPSFIQAKYLKRHWQLNSITHPTYQKKFQSSSLYPADHLFQKDPFFEFYNFRLAVVRDPKDLPANGKKLTVDALILSDNPAIKISELLQSFNTGTLVIDANNAPYRIRGWKHEAKVLGIPMHDVNTDGAFIQNI
ncbi:MAG: ComEC/Rec2 family competence protein [Chitinophagales bacterium]|nr:ComEC/Rec2 family competence protein [Chitinophagales bacterium]